MSRELARRKYKVEFEVTVNMYEIEKINEFPDNPPDFLGKLKRFQKALLLDDEALTRVFVENLLSELEEYVGYIKAPDAIEFFQKTVISSLEAQDIEFFQAEQREHYLHEAVSPVTSDSVSASIDSCAIIQVLETEDKRVLLNHIWQEVEHHGREEHLKHLQESGEL